MTKTRNLSDLLDSNGDVKSTALDNVPASNDASALTTGTLDSARLGTITNFTSTGIDDNATSTSITIDSSQNVLVGKTSPNGATDGGEIRADGTLVNTTNNSTTAYFNRRTSDGDLINFQKDGTTIGNIGSFSSLPYFAGSSYGILIGSGNVVPSTNTGAISNNAMDLGASNRQFKDGYFGGTVTATSFSGSGLGKIGNVVQGVKGDTASSASSGFVAISGLNATITPSSTSSKILASVNVNVGQSTNTTMMFKLYRGTQAVGHGTANGVRQTVGFRVSPDNIHWTFPGSYQYLDSPSTTSAITYYVYWASNGATMYINRNNSFGNDTSNDQSIPISTITLMEILPW